MANTNPARGMRDFLPSEVRKREYVISIIKEVYESYGFEPLETPTVENIETLTGKYGEEGNQLIYKILKRGEKLGESRDEKDLADLALRYDLTVPLARVVANRRNDLPRFFKRYQIQPVWRADRPAHGRFREFYQCDVDAIGSSSMIVEAELCAAVSEILTQLGFNNFTIRINHRKLLTGMLNYADIPSDKHTDALIAIDKLEKIGSKDVGKEFVDRGIKEDSGERLLRFLDDYKELLNFEKKKAQTVIDSIKKISKEDKSREINGVNVALINNLSGNLGESDRETLSAIDDLRHIIDFNVKSPAYGKISIDPSLARGLSYYTGAIFEINVPDLAGSLGGGGRYDGLIGMFGKEQIPACGFSLGLERILVVMEERGMFPKELSEAAADVLVTVWNEDAIGESLKLAAELRKENLRVLVYPEADKLGKQFKYADSIKIPFVCVLGEAELAENKVTLKNMQSGEQETIARESIAAKIKL